MLLLQSLDHFDELALLDPNGSDIQRVSRRGQSELINQKVRGHFSEVTHHQIYFYRGNDEQLHIRVDDVDIELDNNVSVTFTRINHEINRLQVKRAEMVMIGLEYSRPFIDPPLEVDPTGFVDEEDFDIGLFVHNVWTDVARRERIYR